MNHIATEARRAKREELNALPDGIYLNLSHLDYLLIDRISNSKCKKLHMSAGDYWQDSDMNPDREEQNPAESNAYVLGRAYHSAVLEPDKFPLEYCRKLDKEDFIDPNTGKAFPGACMTGTEIGAALKDMGQPASVAGEKVHEKAQRLADCGHEGPIWHLKLAEYEAWRGDRSEIGAKYFDQLQKDAAYIAGLEEIRPFVVGGLSEVTILYTAKDGTRCKTRLDKLYADKIVDFKSFDNTRQKPLRQCMLDDIRYNSYYMQTVKYWLSVRHIVWDDLQIMDATDAQAEDAGASEIIEDIKAREGGLPFFFVFKQKSGVPNCVARELRLWNTDNAYVDGIDYHTALASAEKRGAKSGIFMKGMIEVNRALAIYNRAMEIFGRDEPWRETNMVDHFDDSDFNGYWLDEDVSAHG